MLLRSQYGFVKSKQSKFKLHIQSASTQLTRVHPNRGHVHKEHGEKAKRNASGARHAWEGSNSEKYSSGWVYVYENGYDAARVFIEDR